VHVLAVLVGLLGLLLLSLPTAGCKTCNGIQPIAQLSMQRQLSERALDLRGGVIEFCRPSGCTRCTIDEAGAVAPPAVFTDGSCSIYGDVGSAQTSPSRVSVTAEVAPEGEQSRFQLRVFDAAGQRVYEGEGVATWTENDSGCYLVPESTSI